MASGQEIVDRILKTYGVEFDSTVSGKLNEFMIRYTIDILRLAKNYSIFEKKDTFSLIEVRQAIKQMKENKGVNFDEMQSIFKQMPTHNLEEDIQKTSLYNQIFQYDDRILVRQQFKTEVIEEKVWNFYFLVQKLKKKQGNQYQKIKGETEKGQRIQNLVIQQKKMQGLVISHLLHLHIQSLLQKKMMITNDYLFILSYNKKHQLIYKIITNK